MAGIDLAIRAVLESDKRTSLPCDIPVKIEDWESNGTLSTTSEMEFISLENFISNLKTCHNVPSDEFCRSLIFGIISRLEQANKDLDGQEIITVKDIFITQGTEEKTVVIQCQNGNDSCLQKQLSKVFCHILTNGKENIESSSERHYTDRVIAKDFLDKLRTERFGSWNELTRHPFFWTDLSKIEFVKRYFESVKTIDIKVSNDYKLMENEWKTKENEEKLEIEGINLDLVKGWITKLFLEDDEVSSASKIAVIKLALVPHPKCKPHNGELFFDLVRFFRNTHAHFFQKNEDVRECFGGNDGTGYWQFFSKRYPKMFMDLHSKCKSENKDYLEPEPLPETKFLPPLSFK